MLRSVLAACTIALVLTAPADAAAPWKRVDVSGPPMLAGNGLVIAPRGERGVVILNAAGIVTGKYQFGPGCSSVSAGAGKAVATCSTEAGRLMATLDLRSGAITQVPLPTAYGDYESVIVSAIGARWAQVSVSGNHYSFYDYWNPATGQIVDDPDATHTPDLDTEQPAAALCSPVRRPRGWNVETDLYPQVTVAARRVFYVTQKSVDDPVELLAWHCGQRRPERLTSCTDDGLSPCAAFAADAKHVAWGTRRGVAVLNLRTRRRARLSGFPANENVASVLLRGDRVYVTNERASRSPLTYIARLPRAVRT
jgi:hypothetical protein